MHKALWRSFDIVPYRWASDFRETGTVFDGHFFSIVSSCRRAEGDELFPKAFFAPVLEILP